VRYFGGTLLGVGGLINAYRTAAVLALQVAQVVQKPVYMRYRLHFDYTLINDIMIIGRQFDCVFLQKEMGLYCSLVLDIPKNRIDSVLLKLGNVKGIEVEKVPQ
jgi:putative IMPACT (imprinted ancient) family translation regulator